MCHPLRDLGLTYIVQLWLVGKRVANFLLVLIELFSPAIKVDSETLDIGRNRGVRKGVSHFEHKCQWEWGPSTSKCWCHKTRVPVLSRGVLRDPMFNRFDTIPACDV